MRESGHTGRGSDDSERGQESRDVAAQAPGVCGEADTARSYSAGKSVAGEGPALGSDHGAADSEPEVHPVDAALHLDAHGRGYGPESGAPESALGGSEGWPVKFEGQEDCGGVLVQSETEVGPTAALEKIADAGVSAAADLYSVKVQEHAIGRNSAR
jgi:hypothetical protein